MSGNYREPKGTPATAHNYPNERPRRIWFGPGTVMALLALSFIVVIAEVNRSADVAVNAGPIVYESDRGGHLRQVGPTEPATRSALPAPTRPLWKPEVALLLDRDSELKLSQQQRAEIATLDRAWRAEKSSIEESIRQASAVARDTLDHPAAGHGASLQVIRRGMTDYFELSREFDARRSSYWMRATSVLTPQQQAVVEPGPHGVEPRSGERAQ